MTLEVQDFKESKEYTGNLIKDIEAKNINYAQ